MHFKSVFFLATLLVAVIICGACAPTPLPQPAPTSRPEPSATAQPPTNLLSPSPTPQPSSPVVLSACPVEKQAQAMRKSQIPEWQQIGIFACYQLSLDLTDPDNNFKGVENLIFANQTGVTLDEIVFRIFPNSRLIYNGNMTVYSVQMDGKDISFETFLSDQTGLRLHLDHPLAPEDTTRLVLAYTIEPPLDFGSGEAYGIFNQSVNENVLSLANWYPILAVFKDGDWQADPVLMGGDAVTSQTALYEVTITAPESWGIASTGTQIQQTNEQGLSKHIFVSGPVRDFMVSASPSYTMRQVQVNDLSITQWGTADTQTGWNIALDDARAALAFYENSFGPYPFTELDIVAVPLNNASGVEYPGLILIFDEGYRNTQQREFLKLVIAHEIAHQWWYSLVGNDVLRNPWQDEALATFSSVMFLETSSPGIDYIGRYQTQVDDYNRSDPGQSITQPLAAFQERDSQYGLVVYLKGALFFNDVRAQIGYEAFDKALTAYFQNYRYRLIEPSALLDAFTQSCGCDLKQVEQAYGVQSR